MKMWESDLTDGLKNAYLDVLLSLLDEPSEVFFRSPDRWCHSALLEEQPDTPAAAVAAISARHSHERIHGDVHLGPLRARTIPTAMATAIPTAMATAIPTAMATAVPRLAAAAPPTAKAACLLRLRLCR